MASLPIKIIKDLSALKYERLLRNLIPIHDRMLMGPANPMQIVTTAANS